MLIEKLHMVNVFKNVIIVYLLAFIRKPKLVNTIAVASTFWCKIGNS
jgi:hypothetical protein